MRLVHGGSHHDRPQPGSRARVRRAIIGNLRESSSESRASFENELDGELTSSRDDGALTDPWETRVMHLPCSSLARCECVALNVRSAGRVFRARNRPGLPLADLNSSVQTTSLVDEYT